MANVDDMLNRVPYKTVAHLVYTRERISAARAEALGLVTQLVAPAALESEAETLTQSILSRPANPLQGIKEFLKFASRMKFWSEHASYPFKSHDLWFVTEDIRWGKFEPGTDTKALVNKVNREDLWRDAAKALSLPASDIPASPSRGKETFFDGKVFDPDNPGAYLKSLSIKRVEV